MKIIIELPIERMLQMNLIFSGMIQLIFLVLMLFSNSIIANDIVINKHLSKSDSRYNYTYDLLNLVIEATPEFGSSDVETSSFYMTRDRALIELKSGELINVMAEAPKPEWDKELIVIPIPIRKGIQGLRVFIINNRNTSLMENIDTLEKLIALPTGSGAHWSTKTAMEESGFEVITGSNYDGLFGMAAKERFTTFGRGINEAYKEVERWSNKYPNLMVDEHILLHIPLPTYFYVSPKTPEIAKRIKIGLLRLIENGSFDWFFYKKHCKYILQANLKNRKVFQIPNHLASQKRMLSLVEDNYLLDTKSDFSKICKPFIIN